MYLYQRGATLKFSSIAKEHYNNLNRHRVLKGGSIKYYTQAIKAKVDFNANLNSNEAFFFRDLAKDNYALLERLITSAPKGLLAIIRNIERKTLKGRYPEMTVIVDGKTLYTPFGNLVKGTFDYEEFAKKSSVYNAYELADKLSIDVCCYCNRNYTFTITAGKKNIIRPEFDHFFPQSLFPYLALSFYNLIPSCHICNSNLKVGKNFSLRDNLHPYIQSFDDIARFTVSFKKANTKAHSQEKHYLGLSFFYGNNSDFEIKIESRIGVRPADRKRALENASTFELEKIYNRHKDVVVDIVQNAIIYNDSYINSLLQNFQGTLFRDRNDVLRHITKNFITKEELPKRTFSKLSKDIHEEFGLK